MGNTSSHQGNHFGDNYGRGQRHREEEKTRCYKCSGSGRISDERNCNHCQPHGKTWSQYSSECSCNGYGRRITTKECDDCFGRGYR